MVPDKANKEDDTCNVGPDMTTQQKITPQTKEIKFSYEVTWQVKDCLLQLDFHLCMYSCMCIMLVLAMMFL